MTQTRKSPRFKPKLADCIFALVLVLTVLEAIYILSRPMHSLREAPAGTPAEFR